MTPVNAADASRIGTLAAVLDDCGLCPKVRMNPQQSSVQLPPHLVERLLSSSGEAAWNDWDGRTAVGATKRRMSGSWIGP